MVNPYTNLSDEKLMLLYQQGENQAFELIYARYGSRVYSYLSKKIADKAFVEDVAQNVFVKLHASRHLYCDEHSLIKWIYVITKSVLFDFYRKYKREKLVPAGLGFDELVTDANQDLNIEEMISKQELTENEQQALRLRYAEDLEFSQIANILGVGEANSRKIISRAIKKLRSLYRESP